MAIGERLKEERKKLKMTQAAFAEAGGIGLSAFKLYESNTREPGAIFLAGIAEEGADVQYIVTGRRGLGAMTATEQVLLDGYRDLDEKTKKRMLAFVLTETGPLAVRNAIQQKAAAGNAGKYSGANIGGVVEGDFTGTAQVQVGGKIKK